MNQYIIPLVFLLIIGLVLFLVLRASRQRRRSQEFLGNAETQQVGAFNMNDDKDQIPIETGDFFPPEYKQFPFNEGDLLVGERDNGKFSVSKVLKVDHIHVKQGSSIGIQNQIFTATEDDYLLVISSAYGAEEFASMEDARTALLSGTWTVKIGHVPNRTPGAAAGNVFVGNEPVTEDELDGYRIWKEAFDKGDAGIF